MGTLESAKFPVVEYYMDGDVRFMTYYYFFSAALARQSSHVTGSSHGRESSTMGFIDRRSQFRSALA